jgi:hypothetical protein
MVTDPETAYFWSDEHNTFLSVDPILEPFKPETGGLLRTKLIILGAETGDRKGNIKPAADWIEPIIHYARKTGRPVFMRDSMIAIVGEENMLRELPWRGIWTITL